MADWQDEQQNLKRFSHKAHKGKGTRGKHRGKSSSGDFQPRNMLGRYSVKSTSIEKLSRQVNDAPAEMWLEVHSLVADETAFLATFDFGMVSGVMLIAGSRKSLREAADHIDESSTEDAEVESTVTTSDADERDTEPDNEHFAKPPELDRPTHAFEKNTFRTPKWFGQWRGRFTGPRVDTSASTGPSAPPNENTVEGPISWHAGNDRENKAHLGFSSSACQDFEATFSCPHLHLKEVAMQGWKVTGKASSTAMQWTDFAR